MKAKLPQKKQQKVRQESESSEDEKESDEIEQDIQQIAKQQEVSLLPRMLKKDALFITFTGLIQRGAFDQYNHLSLYFGFVAGSDWKRVTGKREGITQVATRKNQQILWNYPFQITYETTTLSGWPQMIIILYGTDFFGTNIVRGYGNNHLPTSTGKHKRQIRLFCPLPQSRISGILGYFQGCIAEYRDVQKTLAMGDGRQVTRTKPIGVIELEIQCIRYNFAKYGYE